MRRLPGAVSSWALVLWHRWVILPSHSAKIILAASVLLSVGGVVLAVRFGTAADGGRGGAVAVALSFLILFIGPRTMLPLEIDSIATLPAGAGTTEEPDNLPDARRKGDVPPPQDVAALERRLQELSQQLDRNRTRTSSVRLTLQAQEDWGRRASLWLALASVQGTLFWGFGDMLAAWLGATR